MGAVLSLFKTLLSFAILAAIGAYYVYTPRKKGLRPPPPGSAASQRVVAPAPGTKKKGKKAPKALQQPVAVPEAGLATPSQHAVVFPGSLVDAQELDERETTTDPARQPDLTGPPPSYDSATTGDDKAAAKKKRKQKKSAASSAATPVASGSSQTTVSIPEARTPVPAPQPPAPVQAPLNDGPWTRVETRSKKAGAAAAPAASPSISSSGLTTEEDADSSTPEPPKKTLAEKLVPKAPRTKVDDMLEVPHDPSLARVMRIAPGPNDVPATGTWADYDDVSAQDQDSDDGFTPVVKSRGKQRMSRQASDVSTPASPTPMRATETQTKKQRQNAARREASKQAKDDADRLREQTLSRHRRDRINELYVSGGGSKTLSGGQKASVDENTKLVWN
ncbi:hypothetical protein AURDEDRAFT_113060 [Auricularia subglabra TFB-10046 SS5]|nr:hypothetical protein AURDEDRAFT_113060 [Auricularia subglabra TFB-10046 SS5]